MESTQKIHDNSLPVEAAIAYAVGDLANLWLR
jgi:hypothetical protein